MNRKGGRLPFIVFVFRILLVLALVLPSVRAKACGASAGGTSGVYACSLAEHAEEVRKKWRVGVGGGYTSTAIRFGDGLTFDETRTVAVATLDYRFTPRWTFELGAGALLDGQLRGQGTEHDFSPGGLAVAGASYRILDADGFRPFVLLSSQISSVFASTRGSTGTAAYDALDFRLGVASGYSIARIVAPYALARAFGGPVFWRFQGQSHTGTDTHHYQLGAGVSFLIAKRIDVFLEGVPLGERALSAGAGAMF